MSSHRAKGAAGRQPTKASAAAAGLALICVLAIACGSTSDRAASLEERKRAGVVVYNLASEPTTLDPARATRLADLRVIGQCLEGLVRIGGDGVIRPAAAESWQVSPDGRTYTFRLRKARWSNGDPVTAADFEFAWRRVLDPATRAFWANMFFAIEGAREYYRAESSRRNQIPLGIRATDERTLVVRLERPVPYFLSLAALEPYFPVNRSAVERLGDKAFEARNCVANGPFRLVEHIPRRRIVMEPNPHYHARDKIALSRLVFVMVENEFTEWTAYRRGEIDVTNGVHRSALAKMRHEPDFRTAPLVGTAYLCFNCERPPFDKAAVRRAFARAIDRRLLVEHITRSGERPATGFVPPGIRDGSGRGDFRSQGGDLVAPTGPTAQEAERLRWLVESLPQKPVLLYAANELQRSIAVALQMMWRQTLGVEVAIRSTPARLLAQNKRDGDFMIAGASWVADYLDPTTFLEVFRSTSPNNAAHWSNARYDELLDRAGATDDPAERAKLLHLAEQLLIEEMPICPLYFYAIAYLQRPDLEGVERNLLGRIDFRHARWLASNR